MRVENGPEMINETIANQIRSTNENNKTQEECRKLIGAKRPGRDHEIDSRADRLDIKRNSAEVDGRQSYNNSPS